MTRLRVGVAVAAVATVTSVLSAGPASAHEVRNVGAYQITIGWEHEPTYAGVENAVQIFLKDAKGDPVDDLGDPASLQLQIINGNQTSDPLDLKASFDPDSGFGTHGEFDAAIVPTVPGDYTFHLTGSIADQKIDEKFTSSDKTFDPVKDPGEVQFPAKTPSNGDLAQSITRVQARETKAADDAKSSADTATTLAVVGIVVGVLLGGGGLIAGLRGRRRVA